jgi:hypothetical protein
VASREDSTGSRGFRTRRRYPPPAPSVPRVTGIDDASRGRDRP